MSGAIAALGVAPIRRYEHSRGGRPAVL